MCLRTKTNIELFAHETEIHKCVKTFKQHSILEPSSDFERKVQSYVDFDIHDQSSNKILDALKQRDSAASKTAYNLRASVTRWINNIKDALKIRADEWEKLKKTVFK